MREFIGFTKRNMMLYFKDVPAVVFSMLTSIIVFVLYLLFLKVNYVSAIEGAMEGLEDFISTGEVEVLVNSILLTGIIGSAMITVPYSCLQTIVSDKERRVDYDISATPMKRGQIILAYFFASALSAIIVISIILTIGLAVLYSLGDAHMGIGEFAMAYGTVVLGSFSSTALFMVVVMFFKSSSACGAFFGILSAASGFVIGAYMPISSFSEGIQNFCNFFPGSHVTILVRNSLLRGVLNHIDASLGGIDEGMFASAIREEFGFNATLFGEKLGLNAMVLYVLAFAAVCTLVMIAVYRRIYKRK